MPRLDERAQASSSPYSDSGTAPPRIAGRTGATDAAHAAEVVVNPLPASHRPAGLLEQRERSLVDPRLRVDQLERGVEAWKRDGSLGVVTFVEDRRQDGRECRPQPRRPGRADRELEAVGVERESRRHAALEMVTGLRLPVCDVRLAQEVVELDVEAGQPGAGADAEGVREHACSPVCVDRDEVRRVLAGLGNRLERADERECAVRLGQPGEARKPRQQVGDAAEAGAGRDPPTRSTRRARGRARVGDSPPGRPR